ncbi:uncharacterized protein At1g04910-like isoform X1 [Asparagus officinalis]|uniref:uncharacterized protein At1g04910-like isoform X1 n=1 Tax=Asparagus officinalis TaxID=4686 RepID=UPI00098E59D5|nr:uncharacterized protein At1g04910-like isoform X1 [Asparagus officinalis]
MSSCIKHKLPASPCRQTSRYFFCILALWAFLNIFRVILHPPLFCVTTYSREKDDNNDFWKMSETGVDSGIRPCLNFSEMYKNFSVRAIPRKYMMVVVSGGLNQQRNQIVDAVLIARILKAVLVMPVLQVNQVWGDESEFSDIFDETHFKEVLKNDVVIVSSLPPRKLNRRRVRAPVMPFHADEDWIIQNFGNKLRRDSILLVRAIDSKLSKNLNADLQKLRCKVAYEALKFRPWIEETAEKLVKKIGQEGPYLALHLRLEKDVWVRTGCQSGLGKKSDLLIENERKAKPQLLTSRSKLAAQDRYAAGLCPLNAKEISRLLKGLGAPKNTRIYWAGGVPFGGESALEPLRRQFPNLQNKWSLSNSGELNDIKHKPSILAALDYVVCLRSKVFIASHGGNMANSLQGHRIYTGYGKNIKPNKKALVQLYMNKTLNGLEVEKEIKKIHTEILDFRSPGDTVLTKDSSSLIVRNCMCGTQKGKVN